MELLRSFFSFSDPNVVSVVLGAILLTASSAVVGTFTFLKKKALVGDAVAHAVLPGICLAFILSGNKNPLILLIGAFVTGWISLVLIDFITGKSKIKEDTAIALILSVFFGVGILLLTNIQHMGNAAQTGLESFLFGKAAALVGDDLLIFSIVAIILILTVVLFFKELKLIAFDEDYARALGLPVGGLNLLLTSLTVLAVVTGIQAVGVVLMAAMLITPAAAARYWTNRLWRMTTLAVVFAAISSVAGAYISYLAPQMPTGPWIVTVLSAIAIFSFLVAPRKGILGRLMRQRQNRLQMLQENLLKTLYHIGEEDGRFLAPRSLEAIREKRFLHSSQLKNGLRLLKLNGYVKQDGEAWQFTKAGLTKGKKVTRLHRLWELYLTQYLKIAPDHVHEDAESIEHVITPEIEEKLVQLLKEPRFDPHRSVIPELD